jgi:DNA-binding HxlR family transcriptional regulator
LRFSRYVRYNELMRSYGQYCSVAKALDLIGDRWNLLIVRELLLRDSCRYTDLRDGLPGIATNLLADRLRGLEQAGIVAREDAPPPVAATLFTLTERGQELGPILRQLGRWGAPLMLEPADQDAFRGHWLAFPVELFLADQTPEAPPVTIELRTGEEPMTIETEAGAVRARIGSAEEPDLVLSAPPQVMIGLLSGKLALADARARGLKCEGDANALRRVQARA